MSCGQKNGMLVTDILGQADRALVAVTIAKLTTANHFHRRRQGPTQPGPRPLISRFEVGACGSLLAPTDSSRLMNS